MKNNIIINENDNVAIALCDIDKGEILANLNVIALEEIKQGHKIAINDIKEGSDIIKYGFPIGHAVESIAVGSHVHSHNLKTNLNDLLEYSYNKVDTPSATFKKSFFKGYKRSDGRIGIRNEIWIIPTVGCVNSIAKIIEKKSEHLISGNVENIVAFPHPHGCSQLGDDHVNTQKALAGLVKHPNAGGVLVLGLGCENNNIAEFKAVLGEYDENRIRFLSCQDCEDEFEIALEIIEDLAKLVQGDEREDVPVENLVIGLKCGGSDGFSGITANPLVGKFSDMLIANGGTSILTEVPEMFGAETILMDRCKNPSVFNDTVNLINDFKQYYISNNQPVYENPSLGNKAGGITTLEEKSLGCVQKGGVSEVVDVLSYGDYVNERGLNLLEAPGNDLVASTALAVSGAHIVIFTTGRGTPFGSPVPTVKVSTNSQLADKKQNWIDYDAGKLLSGCDINELAHDFYDYIIDVASGKKSTKTEENKIYDMTIFKTGVTL